ncbi:glucosamine-6-phosphate deaminase [Halobacillus locisalis]|uniref:Glucosamine-6-phosphate deaminase n=1 Tax=Halobacillus locisalis TaxID=220753 RepID=A0A838CQW1_9BACI|nr:glucosamine-6-phosphate deaminase [Halobacillus locisalis]MBA2174209.1 glucosamine-6-phosphate deaminase [Halobacillus locisalis]
MNVLVVDNYEQLSERACSIISRHIQSNPTSVLGLATGSTPLGTYKELINEYEQGRVDFQKVRTLNLDEYAGLGPDHPQSYRVFMQDHLFKYVNIDQANTYIPDGKANHLENECVRYEQIIENMGPPDLQLLGIGENGHIGFNEPGSSFSSETHIVELASSTREANARFFSSIEKVPNYAITMGIRSILKSKKIVLLASGERKAAAIERLLSGDVNEEFPASALNHHDDVTLIVDREAYKQIETKG